MKDSKRNDVSYSLKVVIGCVMAMAILVWVVLLTSDFEFGYKIMLVAILTFIILICGCSLIYAMFKERR